MFTQIGNIPLAAVLQLFSLFCLLVLVCFHVRICAFVWEVFFGELTGCRVRLVGLLIGQFLQSS